MPSLLSFSTVFFLMFSSFFVFIFLCTVDMVHCGYPHLIRAASHYSFLDVFSFFLFIFFLCHKCFASSGVMDGVRKSLGTGLYGYWSVWVFFQKISSFTSPDSFLTGKVSKK